MEHILSLSYGKDSLACLGAIEQLGLPLDRIIHAEVWATDTIPADLPPMVEFKAKADAIIKERWGIEVEHIRSQWTFESRFYSTVSNRAKPEFAGKIRGFPLTLGSWCARDLKLSNLAKKEAINYVGIAADEPNRFSQLQQTIVSPLVEIGWHEEFCRIWCKKNDLLSPIYTTAKRGGCWFCPKQPADQLRILRTQYPELWNLLLKWDKDSPVTFHADGHTVHDFDRRFQLEDDGLILPTERFRWSMLDEELNTRLF